MNWLILTVLAIGSRAVYSIATKVMSNRVRADAMTQSVLLTGPATILALLISPFLGGLSFGSLSSQWPAALIMILCQAFGNILFFKGIASLEASVAQIAFSSILLWNVALSIVFLSSSFSLKQSLGIGVLLVAILLVQYRKGVKKLEPAVLYIIAAALLFAGFQVASAQLATTMTAGSYLLLGYGGPTLIIWLIYWRRVNTGLRSLSFKETGMMTAVLSTSVISLLYFVFSYFAYRYAPDRGVVVLLLTSQVVLSVILGIVFLKERQHVRRKLSAGLLALLAGLLIKS